MTGKRNGSKQILRHIDVWDMAFVLPDNVIVFIKKYYFSESSRDGPTLTLNKNYFFHIRYHFTVAALLSRANA